MMTLKLLMAFTIVVFNFSADASESKIMCLPIKNFNGKVTIAAFCDATKLNSLHNLIVDGDGCAVPGQGIQSESAMMLHQAPAKITADTPEELQQKTLTSCTILEAAIVISMDLQPWQQ